jgi:hypothetical protein
MFSPVFHVYSLPSVDEGIVQEPFVHQVVSTLPDGFNLVTISESLSPERATEKAFSIPLEMAGVSVNAIKY